VAGSESPAALEPEYPRELEVTTKDGRTTEHTKHTKGEAGVLGGGKGGALQNASAPMRLTLERASVLDCASSGAKALSLAEPRLFMMR
jgi:hypothetical protein